MKSGRFYVEKDLEEKDLFWIVPMWNLKFLIQREQTTALLWKNYTF